MSGLLRAEIRRLTSRRLARVLALVFLGLLLLVQVVAGAQSREATAEERAQVTSGREFCERAKANGEMSPDENCDEVFGDVDPRYSAADVLPSAAGAVAVGASLMAFVMGASFVGAEWAAGTMQALLFWEPRRGRVLLAKGLALVGVLAVFTVVMQAVGFGTTMLVASARGTTEGVTSAVVDDALGTAARGLLVVSFTGLLGFAVAGLARVTGAALGAAFVYFAILENVVGGLRPGWFRYLIGPNVGALLTGGIDIPAGRTTQFDGTLLFRLTAGRGALTLAVYLTIVVGAFYAVFSRRDVT